MSDPKDAYEALHEFLQENVSGLLGGQLDDGDDGGLEFVEGSEGPEAGVVTGFALVVEVMGCDGKSYLTRSRQRDQPIWRTKGLLIDWLDELREL